MLFIFSNRQVITPSSTSVTTEPAKPASSISTSASLPPRDQNTKVGGLGSATLSHDYKAEAVSVEGQPMFGLKFPAGKIDPRPVRQIVAAQVPDPRDEARRNLG